MEASRRITWPGSQPAAPVAASPRHELNGWSPALGVCASRWPDAAPRVVGWGTGAAFEYFHERHPVQLDLLVDNNAARWGTVRAGIPVAGPDALARLRPEDTLVIVYSVAWREIVAQLAALGFHRVVAAGAYYAMATQRALRDRLVRAADLARQPIVRRPASGRAIVVQGPIVPDLTPFALAVLSARHPRDIIVLSTWADTPVAQIDELRPFVDHVVLSAPPAVPGVQHRNFQIVSTRAGIERARDAGARQVLKTRTDVLHVAPDLFDRAAAMETRFPPTTARAHGLTGRLIVPQSFTRRYLMYHASDLVMLGATDDLLAYWSAPLDLRSGTASDFYPAGCALADIALDGRASESYFGLQFSARVGRSVRGDVHDSWQYYRDLFTVVNNDWFELLWLKNLRMPEVALSGGPRQLVDHQFWVRLGDTRSGLPALSALVDPARTTFQQFYEALP